MVFLLLIFRFYRFYIISIKYVLNSIRTWCKMAFLLLKDTLFFSKNYIYFYRSFITLNILKIYYLTIVDTYWYFMLFNKRFIRNIIVVRSLDFLYSTMFYLYIFYWRILHHSFVYNNIVLWILLQIIVFTLNLVSFFCVLIVINAFFLNKIAAPCTL